MNALELLEFEPEEMEEEKKEPFSVKNLSTATWAFERIVELEQKRKEFESVANKEYEKIEEKKQKVDTWLEKQTEEIDDSKRYFESLLEIYFVESKRIDPKFKLSTPYGKVSSRKQQDKWTYEDKSIIQSLKSKGISHLIKIEEEVKKAELKKSVKIMKDMFALDGIVRPDIKIHNSLFVSMETGEVFEVEDVEFYKQAVAYEGQVIDGVKVEKQPDKITVKAEV